MKKAINILSAITIAFAIVAITGCRKEGPQGPAGNANVVSRTFPVSTWSYSSPNHYANLAMPEITASNISSAAIMVYFNAGGGDWYAVPYTQYNTPDNYVMNFGASVGNVEVTWFYDNAFSSGNNPNVYYGTTVQCKVVVIPPATARANADLDLRYYEEVKERFGLKD